MREMRTTVVKGSMPGSRQIAIAGGGKGVRRGKHDSSGTKAGRVGLRRKPCAQLETDLKCTRMQGRKKGKTEESTTGQCEAKKGLLAPNSTIGRVVGITKVQDRVTSNGPVNGEGSEGSKTKYLFGREDCTVRRGGDIA